MQYFNTLNNLLFYKNPTSFTKHTNKDILKYAIGANMYCPGTQTNLFDKLIHNQFQDIGAITLCLEDAIPEEDVEKAEEVPRWYTYDTPRINTTRTQPRYNYIELLLSRKRNDKQPTLCLQICDFEGSDAASINSLDAMPFYSLLQGAVFVVEETAGSASFAQAFDKWH